MNIFDGIANALQGVEVHGSANIFRMAQVFQQLADASKTFEASRAQQEQAKADKEVTNNAESEN